MSRPLTAFFLSCVLIGCGPNAEPAADISIVENPAPDAGLGPDQGMAASLDAGAADRERAADKTRPKADLPPKPQPDASGFVGGKLVLTCPSSGFHQPPPVEISSVPLSLLPRCSATTKACVKGATAYSAMVACRAADKTSPVTFNGELLDCKACERTQGSYCMAQSCQSQFASYACCSQAAGASCQSLLDAVTTCTVTTGKKAFESCLDALIPLCFP